MGKENEGSNEGRESLKEKGQQASLKHKRVVGQIDVEPSAFYIVNKAGDIVETRTSARVVGHVKPKAGKAYNVDEAGRVWEVDVVELTTTEFFEAKKSGKLKQLYKEGARVEITPDPNASLAELSKMEDELMMDKLRGHTIIDVSIKKGEHAGEQLFTLLLDNGAKLRLKQGLLVGGSAIEFEE